MKAWVFKAAVILIILIQISCAHKKYKMSSVPEWADFHSKYYPCPANTISIGDPRFPNHFVCKKIGLDGNIIIGLR
jgi:hypothetical protein